jgi:hypothetical protein
MVKSDWECSIHDDYLREAICARVLGGTPAEYDGTPKIIGEQDCDALPEDVLQGYQSLATCNDCRVCGNQLDGKLHIADLPGGYGWDELEFCPTDYPELNTYCGEPTGTPTTSDGDEPTTSDGEDSGVGGTGVWKCMGSWTIMGTMHDFGSPESHTEIYMSPPNIPDCVTATDEGNASTECKDLCADKNAVYEAEAMSSPTKNWDPFPCADLLNFTPEEAGDLSECSGGGPMSMDVPKPFTADATLSLDQATATSDQLSGLLEYTFEGCSPKADSCDVSITALHTGVRTVHGVYAATRGAGIPFTVEDLEVRMLQPVLGKMDQATGVITFPDDDLFAAISTGVTTLGGVPLNDGLDRKLFVIDDARGHWDGRGLTLTVKWATPGASLALQVTAR